MAEVKGPVMPPAERSRLSAEQDKAAKAWIIKNCAHLLDHSRGCPACGGSNWNLEPFFGEIGTFAFGGNAYAPGKVWPCFLLTCAKCSLMLSFNAFASGVLERPVTPVKEEAS